MTFNIKEYAGEYLDLVEDFFKKYEWAKGYKSLDLLWYGIHHIYLKKTGKAIPQEIIDGLHKIDVLKVERCIRHFRNDKIPKTIAFDYRQEKARRLEGNFNGAK